VVAQRHQKTGDAIRKAFMINTGSRRHAWLSSPHVTMVCSTTTRSDPRERQRPAPAMGCVPLVVKRRFSRAAADDEYLSLYLRLPIDDG
jgi:hypothetical protein